MATNAAPMTEINKHQEATAEKAPPMSDTEKKQALDQMSQQLAHIEAQVLSGAPDLTPKDVLLDLSDLAAKNPHLHYRWVNIRAPGKADSRRTNGYLRLPADEGGREIGGELAIFVTTKRLHEHRVAQIKKLAKERLSMHRQEMQAAAEAISAEMRSKYGVHVPVDRLFIDEER